MTRLSKNNERRGVSFRRPKVAGKKSGPRKDNLTCGYKVHTNALAGTSVAMQVFIPKIK